MTKILVVSPRRMDREDLEKHLLSPNVELHLASNGEVALGSLAKYVRTKYSYDLVITEIDMPAVSGYKVIDYVRENFPLTAIVAIVNGLQQLKRVPADCFTVMKPFDWSLFREIITLGLEHRIRAKKN